MAEHRHVDGDPKAANRGGRPAALALRHILLLREIVSRLPHARNVSMALRHHWS